MQKPIVAIYCLVYNHEPYLRECFDSFVNQQTSFPFVAVVHEDCSTDNSAAIVREYESNYPDIFRTIYQTENQYSKGDSVFRKLMCKAVGETGAKYVAMCEGDDYWKDPLKLQKQVDFLESHPEYDLYCSSAEVYNQTLKQFTGTTGTPLCEDYVTCIQGVNDIVTATVLMRQEAWQQCFAEAFSYLPKDLIFDSAYWYWFAYRNKVKYNPESMTVYRVLANSASHTANYETELKQQWRFLRLKLYFLAKYPLPKNQSEVMGVIMQELNQVIELSRLCGERKVRQSKTFKFGKFLKDIFRK